MALGIKPLVWNTNAVVNIPVILIYLPTNFDKLEQIDVYDC